jgi:hypothetical protein
MDTEEEPELSQDVKRELQHSRQLSVLSECRFLALDTPSFLHPV